MVMVSIKTCCIFVTGSVPAHLSPVQYTGPSSLPTIMDSPTKDPSILHFPTNMNEIRSPALVSNAAYLRHHPYTVPENLQKLEFNGNGKMDVKIKLDNVTG